MNKITKEYLSFLKLAVADFQSSPHDTALKKHKTSLQGQEYYFFGIHKDQLSYPQVRDYRAQLFKVMGLSDDTPVVQIIGDSARFGAESEAVDRDSINRLALAQQLLAEQLTRYPKHVILYGITGSGGSINDIINNWIEGNPAAAKRVIGNAVSTHTITAIENWGCEASDIHYTTVVYPNALFGDDILLSDQMVPQFDSAAGESFSICFEGGVQSFCQAINMLILDIPVLAVTNLRGPFNSSFKVDGHYISFFSAAEFLSMLKKAVSDDQEMNPEKIEAILNNYLFNPSYHGVFDYSKHQSLRILANPHRQDYSTKLPLFKQGMELFYKKQVWKKLDLVKFVDCEDLFHDYENPYRMRKV